MTETDKPCLRAEHARRTRGAIRAAAFVLARERGYDAVTIDDVAALAGVSRRTVFNYVDSKADLILEPPVDLRPDDVEAFVAGTGTLLEDLVTLLTAGARAAEEAAGIGPERSRERARAVMRLVRESADLKKAMHERSRGQAAALNDALARRLGAEPQDLSVRTTSYLGAALQRAAIDQWVEEDEDSVLTLSQAVSRAGAALGRALAGPAGPSGPSVTGPAGPSGPAATAGPATEATTTAPENE